MNSEHYKAIKDIVFNTLDLCGGTYEPVMDYCFENGLDKKEGEKARLRAMEEYPN